MSIALFILFELPFNCLKLVSDSGHCFSFMAPTSDSPFPQSFPGFIYVCVYIYLYVYVHKQSYPLLES